MIYLDYAATTPMRQEAIEVYTEAATSYYGNSSSLHTLGTQAENLLTLCRKKLSLLVNCREDDLFYKRGTEANYLAIHSLLKGKNDERKHIVTTKLEHSSVLHTLQQLEKEGFSYLTYL
ncbi:aminotransferase class V-fold PLP-dependent enzyme [Priestia megaterium]